MSKSSEVALDEEFVALTPRDIFSEKKIASEKKAFSKVLQRLCYPILIACASGTIVYSLSHDLDFGLANISFLFFCIAYLALFERLIPYEKRWQATAKEWGRDGLYLIITMMGGATASLVIFHLAGLLSPKEPTLPMAIEVFIAIILSSFGTYVFHRLGHDWPWLWRFHGIHHAEGKVNVGNNSVNHIFDVFGRRVLAQLPIIFVGISEPALFIASIFNIMQGYFVHANIKVKIGFLNYFVGSPEQHRLHHSTDVREAGHYCVDITLWDWVFKSYFWKKNRVPQDVGILNPSRFPPPNSIFKSFIHPFRRRR